MSVARFLAETLHAYGVSHVFFMDAILRRSLAEMEDFGIERVLAHSEKAAAYMADGFARASRRPAVCMAQSVGAANLAAGLQDPFLAKSPVIALTGRHAADNQYRNAYQEIPHEPLFSTVCKMTARAESPTQFARLLRQAFREATAGSTAPVHIDVAGHTGSVLDQNDTVLPVVAEPDYARVPAWRIRPDADALALAARTLEASRKPLIVAGIGAMISGAEQAVRKLAEAHSIPVAASLDAKALLPDGHPLAAGIVGTYSMEHANRLAAEADLVIFIGADTGDQITNNWTLPVDGAAIIQIDIDPRELGRNFAGTIGVVGDPATVVEELTAASRPRARQSWLERLHSLKAESDTDGPRSADGRIHPMRLCAALSDWLAPDAVVVADTGYSSHWTGIALKLNHAEQRYLRAAGSLGWAFPASLGVKCAAPDRQVVCFTGDGGFMYHLPELETARRRGLNTITVVNNNHRLAQGLRNLNIAYGDRKGRKEELFVYAETDFAKIATDFGCAGIRVTDEEELRPALDWASGRSLPVVVDVVTDPEALPNLPWTPASQD